MVKIVLYPAYSRWDFLRNEPFTMPITKQMPQNHKKQFFNASNILVCEREIIMSVTLLDQIVDKVNTMNAESDIDDILDVLIKINNDLKMREEKWLKINDERYYPFYYVVRSVILVLEKIIERFQTESKKKCDQTVQDTQMVLPLIKDIIQDVAPDRANADLVEHILEKTDKLVEVAHDANLLKSSEDYLRDVDKNTLLKLYDEMLEIMEVPKNPREAFSVKDDKNTS